MICRMDSLREKEVVNVSDGNKLGWVSDVEIDTESVTLRALVIYGRLKFFGLMGREDDIIIPWENVKLVGDDTILVDYSDTRVHKSRKSMLSGIIEIK